MEQEKDIKQEGAELEKEINKYFKTHPFFKDMYVSKKDSRFHLWSCAQYFYKLGKESK